jgi:menaquinone-dependent protoporphyrinogen oxidase
MFRIHTPASSVRHQQARRKTMTRLLVMYATVDGQTAKIARTMGDALRSQGARVDVIEAGTADPDPGAYAGVIVTAAVHAGGYPRAVTSWARAHAEALRTRPTAFVSVCLGVLQSDISVHRELAAIIRRFLRAAAWHPTETKIVAGALLYTKYNWLKRRIMLRIARKAGGDTDTSRDYEYTDWADLRAFTEQFGRRVVPDARTRTDVTAVA